MYFRIFFRRDNKKQLPIDKNFEKRIFAHLILE
jgi:hypothetical protein